MCIRDSAWSDEFSDGQLNSSNWSRVTQGSSDWNNTASTRADLVQVQNGILSLYGVHDGSKYLTGAVESVGKKEFTSGQVQIRARMDMADGAWPALWMLGTVGSWPGVGEFDLVEHLNYSNKIHQTVHSDYTHGNSTPNDPDRSVTTIVDVTQYNIYSLEWDENAVTFLVNGSTTLVYPRVPEKGPSQYPFINNPMYFILSMQIGGGWVGSADYPSEYPIQMDVDYVRFYNFTGVSNESIAPDPMSWNTEPYMNPTWPDSNVATMTATYATSPLGGIQYYFECVEAAGGDWNGC